MVKIRTCWCSGLVTAIGTVAVVVVDLGEGDLDGGIGYACKGLIGGLVELGD